MMYKYLLHDSIIITDDYDDSEKDLLIKNIKHDLDVLNVYYDVAVYDVYNRLVFTIKR